MMTGDHCLLYESVTMIMKEVPVNLTLNYIIFINIIVKLRTNQRTNILTGKYNVKGTSSKAYFDD